MRESIQCWQCGTRMTLDALASNDGDCPECEVEIHLGEYLSEALDTNQRLEAELAKAHEYGYQYRQERNRAEAELAALKAKAAVPDINQLIELLERVRFTVEEAKQHGNGAVYWNNAVFMCKIALREALAAAPALTQNKEEPTHDA